MKAFEADLDTHSIASIQIISFMPFLDSPAAYILLPAVLVLIWFCSKGKRGPAVLADGRPSLSPIEKKVEQSMGDIIPLTDFDWKTEEPRKIYKFNPKYFLTMGMAILNY